MKFVLPYRADELYTSAELDVMKWLNVGEDWFLDWVLHYWYFFPLNDQNRIIESLGSDLESILSAQPDSEDGIVMFQNGVLEENIQLLVEMQQRVFRTLQPFLGMMPHAIEDKAIMNATHYDHGRHAMVVELELEDTKEWTPPPAFVPSSL